MTRPSLAACAVLAILAVAAPAAQADSISYIKDGNVWLTTPDGSRQFQVTSSGAYADASQADDGTIVALTGLRLHKLDRMGNVLADFDTPVSDSRPAGSRQFFGPYDPAVSPDGTKVAYTYYHVTVSQDPTCFPPQCVTVDTNQGIGYSYSDRQTGWDEPGLGRQSGWVSPAWIDNSEVMLSNPARALNYDVITDKVGDGNQTITEWFTDNGTSDVAEGDVTRQRSKLAFVTGQQSEELRIYAMKGNAPTLPEVCYAYQQRTFSSPTWAPDGARLAWAEADGLRTAPVPDFSAGCTMNGAEESKLIVPGATQPDWGPADVPTGRPANGGGGANGGSGGGSGGPAAGAAITVKRTKLKAALARGLTVKLTGVSGKFAVTAKKGRKAVARGRATANAAGAATARLKFTKAAKRSLRRARKVTLTVAGGGASVKVTLKR
jgi:hypothetical protein